MNRNDYTMTSSEVIPDRAGLWRLTNNCGEVVEFDVYAIPDGHLCAWCDDIGILLSGTTEVWDSDEWLGHIPVWCMKDYGTFEFIGMDK